MSLYFGPHFVRTCGVMLVIGCLAIIEMMIAKRKGLKVYESDQALVNFWIIFINANLTFAVTSIVVYNIFDYFYVHGLQVFSGLNSVAYWLLLFVLQDFLYYWQHLYIHKCRWGWMAHVVHHSASKYNVTVTLRESFAYLASGVWVFFIPLAFLGFRSIDIITMQAVLLAYQTWCHTELIGKIKFLDAIVNTPSNHRVHHGSNPQYIDKNYGAFFIIWDKLFGTYTKEEEPVVYGVNPPLRGNNIFEIYFHVMYQMIRDVIKQKSLKPLVVMPKYGYNKVNKA